MLDMWSGTFRVPECGMSTRQYVVARDRSARIEELLLLMCATLAPTVLISAIWPTLGPFAAQGGGDDGYLHDLLAMRAGGPWHFKLLAMKGIVQMPSYHTVLAVLYTYAFRGTGLIGYVIAALNMAMLAVDPADRRALSGRHARRRGAGARSDRRPATRADIVAKVEN